MSIPLPPPAPNLTLDLPDWTKCELADPGIQSIDNPDKPLNIFGDAWDLVSASSLIRELQPLTHKMGYNLALGGGVLNNGYSMNDLDLLCIPRPALPESDFKSLYELFEPAFGRDPIEIYPPHRTVYKVFYRHLGHAARPGIDLIVFSR